MLIDLAMKYGTDKVTHGFLEVYETVFEPLKDQPIRLLEIGIWDGASHKMWSDYFHNGWIFGIDKEEKEGVFRGFPRIESFVYDQAQRPQLAWFTGISGGKFDIIIDDGGHKMDQQQISLGALFSEVVPGGIYIIEDLHTSFHKRWGGCDDKTSTFKMLQRFIATGQMLGHFLTEDEEAYLTVAIESVEIHETRGRESITSVIRKKK